MHPKASSRGCCNSNASTASSHQDASSLICVALQSESCFDRPSCLDQQTSRLTICDVIRASIFSFRSKQSAILWPWSLYSGSNNSFFDLLSRCVLSFPNHLSLGLSLIYMRTWTRRCVERSIVQELAIRVPKFLPFMWRFFWCSGGFWFRLRFRSLIISFFLPLFFLRCYQPLYNLKDPSHRYISELWLLTTSCWIMFCFRTRKGTF